MPFVFFLLELLLLLKITLEGEFLQNFNLLEVKVIPRDLLTAYMITQYTNKYIS